jgi:hypothetical protein
VEFQDVGEGLFVMDQLNDGYGVKAELSGGVRSFRSLA